jgi:hypothetical protein
VPVSCFLGNPVKVFFNLTGLFGKHPKDEELPKGLLLSTLAFFIQNTEHVAPARLYRVGISSFRSINKN